MAGEQVVRRKEHTETNLTIVHGWREAGSRGFFPGMSEVFWRTLRPVTPARTDAVTDRRRTDMDRFEDKRINEALELLNAAARDQKTELRAAMESKYTDLAALLGALGHEVRSRAVEKYEAGRQKVVDTAGDIDKSVHRNPWAYIGGTMAAALLLGFVLGRSRRD